VDEQELQKMRSKCCGEVVGRLNDNEVVQIWRFDGSENFVSN